jgi:hypothetical protein
MKKTKEINVDIDLDDFDSDELIDELKNRGDYKSEDDYFDGENVIIIDGKVVYSAESLAQVLELTEIAKKLNQL